MSKTFYYDYFSLDGVDPEAWSDEFFWPVPRQTTTKITTDLKNHLSTLATKQNDRFESELLIIAHLMPDASIRSVNHLLAVNRIKEKGYNIVCETEKLKLIPQLLENPEEISFEHEDIWSQHPLGWKNRQFNKIRYFLISVRYNFKRGIYRFWEHFKKRAKTVAFSNANVIYRPSTLESPEWIKLTAAELWISPVIPTLNEEQKEKIR